MYNDFLKKIGWVGERFIQLKRDQVKVAVGVEHVVGRLCLILYTGIRVLELVNIKQTDIDQLTATLTVRGKGSKVREISLR